MKRVLLFAIILFSSIAYLSFSRVVFSDELDDLNKEISALQKELSDSEKATKPHEQTLTNLTNRLSSIESQVVNIENDLEEKRAFIKKGYQEFEKHQELFNLTVRNYYIKNYSFTPLLVFISSQDAAQITRLLTYQRRDANDDKVTITNIALLLSELEEKKKQLEGEEKKLAAAKIQVDQEKKTVEELVTGAKAFQSDLKNKIAALTAKQQQLLAAKLGSLNLPSSLGAGPLYCTDDRKIDPGFSPAFAFYTFGIPHRVGLNQYGAQGRAQAGQSHEDILHAYFDNINFEQRDTNTRIKVQGYGEMGLEEYMLGIYEMPNSFPLEALKAQAIAARSYVLAYTDNGQNEICTTQACQVYKGGNKGGAWEQAVKDTAGKVMVSDGQVITAWYASTAGGYTFNNNDVWGGNKKSWTKRMRDTSGDVGSFDDLMQKSYDKDSPCLYAAQGFRSEYGKSAWLKSNEVADITNVLMLAKADSSTQVHLVQIDKDNPDGAETWNAETVRQELKSRGITGYSSVSDVSVNWDKGTGQTTSVTVNGDAGSKTFGGDEYRDYFNLRAPANIQIVGPLFNIERK